MTIAEHIAQMFTPGVWVDQMGFTLIEVCKAYPGVLVRYTFGPNAPQDAIFRFPDDSRILIKSIQWEVSES